MAASDMFSHYITMTFILGCALIQEIRVVALILRTIMKQTIVSIIYTEMLKGEFLVYISSI